MTDKKWDCLSLTYALRVGSPTPSPAVSALLCCPGDVQVLLSLVRQSVRFWASSLVLMTSGPALPTEVGGERCGEDISPLFMPLYGR